MEPNVDLLQINKQKFVNLQKYGTISYTEFQTKIHISVWTNKIQVMITQICTMP